MIDDIRYSELLFLRALAKVPQQLFNPSDSSFEKAVGMRGDMLSEMVATLIEDMYIAFHRSDAQLIVSRLRGELAPTHAPPMRLHDYLWSNPREAVRCMLNGQTLENIRITYRGLRRIEELRDLLRADRILEHFGVLLDLRYFRRDVEDALHRGAEVPVSVLCADMDDFGKINKQFGQAAGDVIMQAYLKVVQEKLGLLGTAYRGLGDEVVVLITGQSHARAITIAEAIRLSVELLSCEYDGKPLPQVTASLGVATAPPESRDTDIEHISEERKKRAKDEGKNRVVFEEPSS